MEINSVVSVVMTVALCVQALGSIALVVVLAKLLMRSKEAADAYATSIDARLRELTLEVRALNSQLRATTAAAERRHTDAEIGFRDPGQIARVVASAVTGPRSLVVAGAASVATKLYDRWRQSRIKAARPAQADASAGEVGEEGGNSVA